MEKGGGGCHAACVQRGDVRGPEFHLPSPCAKCNNTACHTQVTTSTHHPTHNRSPPQHTQIAPQRRHTNPHNPTVSGVNSAVLDVFRTANALEQRLDAPVNKARAAASAAASTTTAAAAAGGESSNGNGVAAAGAAGLGLPLPPAVSDVVCSYSRWDLMGPLKTGLLQVRAGRREGGRKTGRLQV